MMLSEFIYAVFCAETTFCSKPLIGFSFYALAHTAHTIPFRHEKIE